MGKPDKLTAAEFEERDRVLRKQAWQQHGLAVIKPSEIENEWLHDALVSEFNEQYGKRQVKGSA